MDLEARIRQYTAHFAGQISEIDSLTCADLSRARIYKKILFASMIDTLSQSVLPEKVRNRCRFVGFVDRFGAWELANRISLVQLKLSLENNAAAGSPLHAFAAQKIDSWGEGGPIRADADPSLADLERAGFDVCNLVVKNARFVPLLYTYRNHLVHEFREPGYPMECKGDRVPYYMSITQIETGNVAWELVFPVGMFRTLCITCLENLQNYLIKEGIDPYGRYQFGTQWKSNYRSSKSDRGTTKAL